jgi:hypothetical protein
MIKIQYDRNNGISMPDGKVEGWVDEVVFAYKHGHSGEHLVANESIINEFRLRVARQELAPTDISFVYDTGSTVFLVPIDAHGFFAVTPVGFCDYTCGQALALLSATVGKEQA